MNQPTSRITDLDELAQKLRAFAAERDWEPYHTPKNLAAALIVEAAELLEHFQWLDSEASARLAPEQREQVALEMADVLLYLVRMADRMGIDLLGAATRKLAINARKYPVALARGTHAKYTDLGKP
jgi:NTP pyrophosphatase (non-canonical NTP hydrolase)